MITQALEFIRLNGFPLFVEEAHTRCCSRVRSFFVARKLGAQGFRIGAGSYIRGLAKMKIGNNFSSGDGLWLEAITRYRTQRFEPTLMVGSDVSLSNWVHIGCTNRISIGDHTLIGSNVVVVDHNHGQYAKSYGSSPTVPPSLRSLDNDKTVTIGRNVWLGDAVVVLPGAVIGDGCVVAANSVVSGEIPPFTIAVGTPARPIKQFDFKSQEWKTLK